ncbi:HNH endonuclease [Flavobacterium sp. I3-2]|uniref:HNH endonuclease n=1 Tax=Flavobacterium sp. I3-2 TaxID=2748319 RepID=UPI0015B07A7D|nr:HNH endonuclease signature motif containing protein [Flavobacterium sp. I3-2]
MKNITRPTETINDILDIFLNDRPRQQTVSEIDSNRTALIALENQYITKTQDNTLYEISRGIPASITLTEESLIRYYEYRMLERDNGRNFYDKLLISVPYNTCPYCTIKNVTTIDHFLPKSKYPFLSVTPTNLVPSCRDCNTDKKVSYPTNRDNQTFHPYFDIVDNEPWIIAELLRAEPLSFHFKVQRIPTWDDNKYSRSLTHFDAYKINELFSSEANNELRGRRLFFKRHIQRNRTELIDHLNETYQSYLDSFGLLDWRTVMYHCLINDDWFLDGCAGNNYFN